FVVFPMAIEAVVNVVLKPAGRVMLETFKVVPPALDMVMDNCAEEPTKTLLKFKLPLTAMALTLGAALAIWADTVRKASIATILANEDSFRYSGVGIVSFDLFKL